MIATAFVDAMRVAPPVDAIIAWAEQAVEKEQRRRERLHSTSAGYLPADAPMRLRMEWRAGSIDPAASGIVQPELAGVRDIADSPADLAKLAGTPLSDEGSADPYRVTQAQPA